MLSKWVRRYVERSLSQSSHTSSLTCLVPRYYEPNFLIVRLSPMPSSSSSSSSELQVELSKIRPHTSSNLAHQKKPVQLLGALESTIESTSSSSSSSSSSAAPTPAGYFAALLTTLEGTLARNETSLNEGDILPATLYLLSIVVLFVPPALLRSQCPTLLPLLTPLLPYTNPHAPSLRSLITILGAFISSLDSHSLDAPGVRNGFSTLVEHTIDPHPKVRRKAAEAVRDILSKPPTPQQA